jgi:hypothetical protein
MKDEWWIGKNLEGSSLTVIEVLSRRLPVETEESYDDNQCPDRDSNQTPPECKSGSWALRQLFRFIGNIATAGYIEFTILPHFFLLASLKLVHISF